jgi:hypothetical protein
MVIENTAPGQAARSTWCIDAAWYERTNRSFYDLARRGLCPKCVEKMGKKKKKPTENDVMNAIKDCCAQTPEFITGRLPVMETVFRVMLANGNAPMSIEDIGKQVNERRGGDAYTASPVMLERLLSSDKWYGFKRV